MDGVRGMMFRKTNGKLFLLLIIPGQEWLSAVSRINSYLHLVEELTREESLTSLKSMTSKEEHGKKYLLQFATNLNGSQLT